MKTGRATSFMLSLLSICLAGSLYSPPITFGQGDEFSVNTDDFSGMKRRATDQFNRDLDDCHKIQSPPEREECKRQAGDRFARETERINEMWRNAKPRRQSKPDPTLTKKPTTQPQQTHSSNVGDQKKPQNKETAQPRPPSALSKPPRSGKVTKTQPGASAKEIDQPAPKTKEPSQQKTPAKDPGQQKTPAKQTAQPQPVPSTPSKPPRYEDIPNLGQVPCVDLAASSYLVDKTLAPNPENSFNCHFYTKAYMRTVNPASGKRLSRRASGRDECMTDDDLAAAGFRLVPLKRARVGDIIVVEGPDAVNCDFHHSAVVTEVDASGRILKLRQKDDPNHCVIDTTLDQFKQAYMTRSYILARLYSPRRGGGRIP